MADLISYGLLCFGVFAGAFVSGLAGFAFSAVAGVFVLHVRTPTEAVPLMVAQAVENVRCFLAGERLLSPVPN